MYLLYIDDSGSVFNSTQNHFILAGLAVFERSTYWISKELDNIASRFNSIDPYSIELHGSPMVTGRNSWRKIPKKDRIKAIEDALNVVNLPMNDCILFGACVNKSKISPEDPIEYCFEQINSRFDHFLRRKYNNSKKKERGMIIFDKSTSETAIQQLAIQYREIGHTWGSLKNMAEVPSFIDSKASRLIQLADLIAYSMFRHYEKQDSNFFNIFQNKFDTSGGIKHGLFEKL